MNENSNIIGLLSSITKTVYLYLSGTVLNLCGKFLFMHHVQVPEKTILLASSVKDFRAYEEDGIIYVSGQIQTSQNSWDQGNMTAENATEPPKTSTITSNELIEYKYGQQTYQCFQFDLICNSVYNYHLVPDVKIHCYNHGIMAAYYNNQQIPVELPIIDSNKCPYIQVNNRNTQKQFTINGIDGNVTIIRIDKRHIYIVTDDTKLFRYSDDQQMENLNNLILPAVRIQDVLFRDNNTFVLQKRDDLTVITCINTLEPYKNIVQRTIQSAQLVSYGEKLCYKIISGHFAVVELTNKLKIEHMQSHQNGIGIFYCHNQLRGSKANSPNASDYV